MSGFHPHFHIIPPQTISFRGTAPELVLALAAVGSNYCFESHQGSKLLTIAKSIVLEQARRRDMDKGDKTQTIVDSELRSDYRYVETIEAMFYLSGNCMSTVGVTCELGIPDPGFIYFDSHDDVDSLDVQGNGYFDAMGLSMLRGES